MIYEMLVKPFHVLNIYRTKNMTSWSTQMVDESEVNPEKGDPELRKEPSTEEELSSRKSVCKTFIQTIFVFYIFKVTNNLVFLISSGSVITVNIVISSGIELVKQTWFLLARKDSQAEGFSAN